MKEYEVGIIRVSPVCRKRSFRQLGACAGHSPHSPTTPQRHRLQADGQQIQSARVPVTLDAPGGTYQAKGLLPGTPYKIDVRAM